MLSAHHSHSSPRARMEAMAAAVLRLAVEAVVELELVDRPRIQLVEAVRRVEQRRQLRLVGRRNHRTRLALLRPLAGPVGAGLFPGHGNGT